jgi:predicted PurR-regulated permease PerM
LYSAKVCFLINVASLSPACPFIEFSTPTGASELLDHPSPSVRKTKPSAVQSRVEPVRVELVQHHFGVVESIGLVGTSIAHFAEMAGGVLIFTLFMLMQRNDLRNRLFRLLGQGHLNVMTTALDDAASRVSKYLFTQSLINGSFGLCTGLGLYWIGVPNAPFWGVLAGILRFIPYLGSFIAGICPLVLALAVFEGWTRPLLTLGLIAINELVVSCVVEPWLYGAHTGLSSLAILVSAAFWTLLWGPIGLILSTPLTVCLLVIGRYVPSLSPLAIMLGDQPVLPPEACYYQRLLAGDEEEAQEIAERYLKEHELVELYDSVLIPALSLAEQDRHDDALDDHRAEFIYQNTKSLIEDLGSPVTEMRAALASSAGDPEPLWVACVPARDKADELVALMLSQILRKSGYNVTLIPLGSAEDPFYTPGRPFPGVIIVSALPPLALSHARTACRRLRPLGTAKVIVGIWNSPAEKLKAEERWGRDIFDLIVVNLKEAETQLRNLRKSEERTDELADAHTEATTL